MSKQKIYKYEFADDHGLVTMTLPRRSSILTVNSDLEGHLCLWAMVTPGGSVPPLEREFRVVFTGEEPPPLEDVEHVWGGIKVQGLLIVHVFLMVRRS